MGEAISFTLYNASMIITSIFWSYSFSHLKADFVKIVAFLFSIYFTILWDEDALKLSGVERQILVITGSRSVAQRDRVGLPVKTNVKKL